MKVYLVRNVETKGILGVFVCTDTIDLWWSVDAYSDPSNYEYLVIRKSAWIVFDADEPIPQQSADENRRSKGFSWSKARADGELWNALHEADDYNWQRLPYSDQPGGGAFEAVAKAKRDKRGVYAENPA